jgi:hypothetical protein
MFASTTKTGVEGDVYLLWRLVQPFPGQMITVGDISSSIVFCPGESMEL